jgi:hypothetical protein
MRELHFNVSCVEFLSFATTDNSATMEHLLQDGSSHANAMMNGGFFCN